MTLPEGHLEYDSKKPLRKCPACAGPMVPSNPDEVCIRCKRKNISAPKLTEEEDPW